jgi:hypothetical protein
MRQHLKIVLLTSALSGCSSAALPERLELALTDPPKPTVAGPGSPDQPAGFEESQGRTLVGSALGEPEPVFKFYAPANVGSQSGSGTLQQWTGSALQPIGPGAYFEGSVKGASWPNGAYFWVKVMATDSPDSSADDYVKTMDPDHKTTTLYTLYFVNRYGEPIAPFCQPDYNGSIQSIIQPGYFDDTGALHLEDKTVFTFGCLSGVIGKCAKWKYLPWEVSDMHWACTRAARADYCGNGQTHTLDNTPVDVYDNHSPAFRIEDAATPTDGRPHVTYESAWTTSGSYCVTGPRWPQLIDPAGKQLCGASSPIIDPMGNPYLCGSFTWAIKVGTDRGLPGPFIAIDSNHGPLPH